MEFACGSWSDVAQDEGCDNLSLFGGTSIFGNDSLFSNYLPPSNALLHGMFDTMNSKWGPTGNYVYVPKGFRRPDEEYIAKVFRALNITPNIFFKTLSNDELIFPDLGLTNGTTNTMDVISSNPTTDDVNLFQAVAQTRLKSKFKAIANAFVHGGAVYIFKYAQRSNGLVNLITSTLPREAVSVAVVNLEDQEYGFPASMKAAIRSSAVPLTDDVKQSVFWSDPSISGGCQISALGLNNVIIFESSEDNNYFWDLLSRVIPVGLLCSGMGREVVDAAEETLRRGLPLIVIKHGRGAGHWMHAVLEHQAMVSSSSSPNNGTSVVDGGPQQRMASAPSFRSINTSIKVEDRLLPEYDLTKHHVVVAQQLVFDWPTNINKEAILCVDPFDTSESPEKFLVRVASMLASVKNTNEEEGKYAAEIAALDQASSIYAHLHNMEAAMDAVAAVLVVMILVLKFLITAVAIVDAYLAAKSATKDGREVHGLALFNTILPIVLGIFLTINESYEPTSKAATLRWAKERIKSEWFQFR